MCWHFRQLGACTLIWLPIYYSLVYLTALKFNSVQFSSVTQLCLTLCDPIDCSTPGLPVHTNSRSLLKLMSIELVMPSNQLILCRPLLLLPSIFPSIRVFSNESALRIRWPKYLSFSCSISPSNEYSGMTSFQIDWLELLAVQGTLKVFSNTTVHLMSTGQSSFKNLDIKHIMKRTS